MATIGATVPTIIDVAKRLGPDHKIARIIEMLVQKNPMFGDLAMEEGNLPTGTQTTVRTGLPTVYWRLLNQGVPPSKSTTAQVTEQAGILEARAQIDVDLALLNGNKAEWRLSENTPFIEAMNQEAGSTFWYGNQGTSPEEFTGMSPRYSSLSAGNAQNIIDGGGTGSDNASIWFISTSPTTIHLHYPKGSVGGLQHKDFGEQDAFDSNGNRFRALLDWYQWKIGLAVRDWRYAVRIANLDISTLVAQSGQPVMIPLMIKALHRLPDLNSGRTVIYMNRTVAQYLEIETRSAVSSGAGLTYENVDGVTRTSWRGIPIRLTDSLLETEARVT
jgi:hypothetical protein